MKNRLILFCLILIHLLLISTIAKSQSHPFIFNIDKSVEGQYSGDGLTWILDTKEGSQFILFGEQHGVSGISEFVHFIYDSLSGHGYNNLVLEIDRWTASVLESKGIDDFINNYPHSLAFDYNGDLRLISSNLEKENDNLWGVDQMITAIHPFQRLNEIAPNFNASRLSRGAFLKSSLKAGEYLREEHFRDLDRIKESYGGNISAEATLILTDLRKSMDIYTKWRAGARGEISKMISPEIREKLMKNRLDFYLGSSSLDESKAKAIFKMGGAHTMYGIGPNGVETLGEHAKKIAVSNNMKTLSIGIRRYNKESVFPPIDYFDDSNIILIDNSEYLKAKAFDSTLPSLAKYDNQFDALIYLKNAPRASKTIIYSKEKKFEQNLLIKIGLLGIFAILILTSGILLFFLKKYKNLAGFKAQKKDVVTLFLFSLFTNGILWLQVYFFLSYPSLKATILPSAFSSFLFLGLSIVAFYLIFRGYLSWSEKRWNLVFRSYFSFLTILSLFLTLMMYWLNIGGMLS